MGRSILRGWGGGNVGRSLVGSQFGKVLGGVGDEGVPAWAGPGGVGGSNTGRSVFISKGEGSNKHSLIFY